MWSSGFHFQRWEQRSCRWCFKPIIIVFVALRKEFKFRLFSDWLNSVELRIPTIAVFKVMDGKKKAGSAFLATLMQLPEQMKIFIVAFLSTL